MYAEKMRAFISALPAASNTLFGCQSTDSTVDLIGFLSSLETHQSPSGSNEQIAIALIVHVSNKPSSTRWLTYRAPLATANLSSLGLQRTCVAARLMRNRTRVGFQIIRPVCGSGLCCHTYALRSWAQVTIRFELGAQSMEVISLSCYIVGGPIE